MYVCMYVCLIPPGWNPAKSGAAPRATTKKPSPTWNNQLRLRTTAVDGAPLVLLTVFQAQYTTTDYDMDLYSAWLPTLYSLQSLLSCIHTLSTIPCAAPSDIEVLTGTRSARTLKSAIRVHRHGSSSVSLIDSQIATRSPRVHGSTGPRLQSGIRTENSTFMYYI